MGRRSILERAKARGTPRASWGLGLLHGLASLLWCCVAGYLMARSDPFGWSELSGDEDIHAMLLLPATVGIALFLVFPLAFLMVLRRDPDAKSVAYGLGVSSFFFLLMFLWADPVGLTCGFWGLLEVAGIWGIAFLLRRTLERGSQRTKRSRCGERRLGQGTKDRPGDVSD